MKNTSRKSSSNQSIIVAKVKNNEPRIDSRLIALGLGVTHTHLVEQVDKYKVRLSTLGLVRFETEKVKAKMGRPVRFVYLNENQCYALVTLSKNTERAVDLKFALVKAFSEAREALAANIDYLPSYREAHDNLAQLLRLNESSVPDRVHHINLERMINACLGIPPGSRQHLPPSTRSAVAIAERIASAVYEDTLKTGQNHKIAYQRAKSDVLKYAATVMPSLPILECAA